MVDCYQGCENCDNPICTCFDLSENENYQNCKSDIGNKWINCFIACGQSEIIGSGSPWPYNMW